MTAKHGTRHRYVSGCRCDDCKEANRLYQRDLRQRRAEGGPVRPATVVSLPSQQVTQPGPVESGAVAELEGLMEVRPGLAQAALAVARILDNPKAVSQQPAAAKVLGTLLDKLRAASAQRRRGDLALVRTMAQK
jgi:hypothetical protein